MSKLEKLKDKAKGLEARDPRGAIDAWLEVLKVQEEEGEPNPDLSVFNRVGDLYLKVKDPAQAADYYDRAVDKYAELGFHNNAIAMCNKVLRNAPGRQTTYLKLAKLYAAKGFVAEAKLHFVEYAERMQKIGKIQHAFAALKEFTDISPENTQLRGMLEEHLLMYGTAERRPSIRAPSPAAPPPPHDDVSKSGKRKTSSLVFLDVDAPPGPKGKPVAPPLRPPEPEPEDAPLAQSLVESVTPAPARALVPLGAPQDHAGRAEAARRARRGRGSPRSGAERPAWGRIAAPRRGSRGAGIQATAAGGRATESQTGCAEAAAGRTACGARAPKAENCGRSAAARARARLRLGADRGRPRCGRRAARGGGHPADGGIHPDRR